MATRIHRRASGSNPLQISPEQQWLLLVMKPALHLVALTTILTFSLASLADDWPQWMGPRLPIRHMTLSRTVEH